MLLMCDVVHVLNIDQSSREVEMRSNRTKRKTLITVRSINETTHSCPIQSTIRLTEKVVGSSYLCVKKELWVIRSNEICSMAGMLLSSVQRQLLIWQISLISSQNTQRIGGGIDDAVHSAFQWGLQSSVENDSTSKLTNALFFDIDIDTRNNLYSISVSCAQSTLLFYFRFYDRIRLV